VGKIRYGQIGTVRGEALEGIFGRVQYPSELRVDRSISIDGDEALEEFANGLVSSICVQEAEQNGHTVANANQMQSSRSSAAGVHGKLSRRTNMMQKLVQYRCVKVIGEGLGRMLLWL